MASPHHSDDRPAWQSIGEDAWFSSEGAALVLERTAAFPSTISPTPESHQSQQAERGEREGGRLGDDGAIGQEFHGNGSVDTRGFGGKRWCHAADRGNLHIARGMDAPLATTSPVTAADLRQRSIGRRRVAGKITAPVHHIFPAVIVNRDHQRISESAAVVVMLTEGVMDALVAPMPASVFDNA